jgi:hypothetical protein
VSGTNKRPRVCVIKNRQFKSSHHHPTGITTTCIPYTKHNPTCALSMDQDYPITLPTFIFSFPPWFSKDVSGLVFFFPVFFFPSFLHFFFCPLTEHSPSRKIGPMECVLHRGVEINVVRPRFRARLELAACRRDYWHACGMCAYLPCSPVPPF